MSRTKQTHKKKNQEQKKKINWNNRPIEIKIQFWFFIFAFKKAFFFYCQHLWSHTKMLIVFAILLSILRICEFLSLTEQYFTLFFFYRGNFSHSRNLKKKKKIIFFFSSDLLSFNVFIFIFIRFDSILFFVAVHWIGCSDFHFLFCLYKFACGINDENRFSPFET